MVNHISCLSSKQECHVGLVVGAPDFGTGVGQQRRPPVTREIAGAAPVGTASFSGSGAMAARMLREHMIRVRFPVPRPNFSERPWSQLGR